MIADLGAKSIPPPLSVTTHATPHHLFAAVISGSVKEYALVASSDAGGAGPWVPLEIAQGAAIAWREAAPPAAAAAQNENSKREKRDEVVFAALVVPTAAAPAAPAPAKKKVRAEGCSRMRDEP